MPKLQRLNLTLDCSNLSVLGPTEDIRQGDNYEVPSDPTFDEFDQETASHGYIYRPRKGHVRDAFINSALDETLARAIFNCISSSKSSDSLPLDYLKLIPTGGDNFGGNGDTSITLPPIRDTWGVENIAKAVSLKWELERSLRDDENTKVIAKEIGQAERIEYFETIEVHHGDWDNFLDIEPVFRRIWPKSGGLWWDDWRSFPLVESL
ncbi:hypothetical protein F5884DRAFT_265969 [Xylogone sp. PMI_703]|nr:hypothetical protein F5884DRAFT_265969 [Xylogone sp. PMI_703]